MLGAWCHWRTTSHVVKLLVNIGYGVHDVREPQTSITGLTGQDWRRLDWRRLAKWVLGRQILRAAIGWCTFWRWRGRRGIRGRATA